MSIKKIISPVLKAKWLGLILFGSLGLSLILALTDTQTNQGQTSAEVKGGNSLDASQTGKTAERAVEAAKMASVEVQTNAVNGEGDSALSAATRPSVPKR